MSRPDEHFRWTLRLLPLLLGGYMFFGRVVAYLHVPGVPVYIGEVVLAVGLVELLAASAAMRHTVLRSGPLRVLAALLVFGLLRLAVDLPSGGLDAARDSAVIYYGLVAVLVATVVRVRVDAAPRWVDLYERALPAYLIWAPISVLLHQRFSPVAPLVPDSLTPVTDVKVADVCAFCAIGIAYLWLRPDLGSTLRRRWALWTSLGFVGLLMAGTQTRGGLLAGAVILALTLAAAPDRARIFFTGTTVAVLVLGAAVLLDLRVTVGYREISPSQLVENLASLAGEPENAELADSFDQNVTWRTGFWADIIDDNLLGDDAATGQGFGPNLAQRYQLDTRYGEQGLRNAHNSHLSVLARLGVPGLLLWTAFWCALGRAVLVAHRRIRSRSRAEDPWLLAWAGAGLTGILLNAVFDPNLEGPQVAFWAWTLAGLLSQAARRPALATGSRDDRERRRGTRARRTQAVPAGAA